MVNDVPFPASVLRPERLGEHEHERRRRKLVRNVLDAPLQSPESRVPAPEHFSRLNFRKTRDLFLQQRRRLDGDRRASALARGGVRGGVRGATRSALSFVAVVDARLARPGDGRGSTSARVVRVVRVVRRSRRRRRVAVAIAIAIAIGIVASAHAASSPRARFAGDASSLRRVLARRALARGAFVVAARPIARRGASASSSRSFGSLARLGTESTRLNFKTDAVGHSVTKRRDTAQKSRERGRRRQKRWCVKRAMRSPTRAARRARATTVGRRTSRSSPSIATLPGGAVIAPPGGARRRDGDGSVRTRRAILFRDGGAKQRGRARAAAANGANGARRRDERLD